MRASLLTILIMILSVSVFGQSHVATMNTDGTYQRQIYSHGGAVSKPHWSPDMTKITFGSSFSSTERGEIFSYDLSQNLLCQLTNYGHYYGQWNSRFYENGNIWYRYHDGNAGNSELGYLIIEGCNVLDSGVFWDYNSTGRQTDYFDISLNYIAFYVQISSASSTGDIYIAPLTDLTDTTRLTTAPNTDFDPDISVDETKIVYLHSEGVSQANNIMTMNIDGSNKIQLTFISGASSQNNYSIPLFSEDNSFIYFSYWDGLQSDIFAMNADGTNPLNITNTSDYDEVASELRNGKLLYSTTEELPSDFLIIPSVTAASCDDECIVQPINVDLLKAIKGATIPLKIPAGIEICSLSTQGLITEGWTFQNDVKIDSGFISTGLWNLSGDSIPAGENTVFNIYYKAEALCNEDLCIYWDTTLYEDISRRLVFADMNNQDIYPGFEMNLSVDCILGYIPGDFNNDGQVGISDLTALVDYMFNGGDAPCKFGAGDINKSCDGVIGISDLTYLVDYLFNGGPAPSCECASTPTSKIVDKNYSVNTFYKDNTTIIQLNSLSDIRGLQLELAGTSIGEPLNLSNKNLELLHSYENNVLKLGLLDLNGGELIKSGSSNLIKLEGKFEIVSATISDMNHNSITPTINSAVKGTLLPIVFSLNQNYPNPFNPATEISYSLPKAGFVKLEVYNTLGQRVVSLIDEQKEAGVHSVNWDASSHASGIYLYKIQAGEFVETKKMMLLK